MSRREQRVWAIPNASPSAWWTATAWLALLVWLTACGTTASVAAGADEPMQVVPTRPVGPPGAKAARQQAVAALGRLLWRALMNDAIRDAVFDDVELRTLLDPEAATRSALLRHNLTGRLTLPFEARQLLQTGSFDGVCVQNARLEAAHGALGLAHSGWVFDRILVAVREPGGGRVAAWVEGTFVYTDAGFGAVNVARVETPRRDHADLQLAVCDVAWWASG